MKTDLALPQSVQSVLWSYDLNRIDLDRHRRIIISQVLNFGTEEAIRWLFQRYGKDLVKTEADQIPLGQWDKKSLALWSLVLGINPPSKLQKMGAI